MCRRGMFSPLNVHSHRARVVVGFSIFVALLFLALDQGTKIWVEQSFAMHESRPLIDGWLSFTSVRNYGAAWSLLSGYGWILLLVAVAALTAILWFFNTLTEGYPERYFATFLVISGILGNSIDRLWRGAVVDFIDVHCHDVWHYPVFNVADIAISTGVGIFILSSFLRPSSKKDADKAK